MQIKGNVLFLLLAISAPSLAQVTPPVNVVVSGIANIVTLITTLSNLLQNIPTGSTPLASLTSLHTAAQAVNTAVTRLNPTIKSLSPSDIAPAAQGIFDKLHGIEPVILQSLQTIITKQGQLTGGIIPGVKATILSDLRALNASNTDFENFLIAIAPANLVGPSTSIKVSLDQSFAAAITSYS